MNGDAVSNTNYITFGRPCIGEEEIEAVVQTLRGGWVGTGPQVKQFQEEFGNYIGCRHAVPVGSCTAALQLALESSGMGPGDEVITTPLTFAATANAIVHAGATPVFADVKPNTMNIDPDDVEARITPRTRAILPVHFAGRPCDMGRLRELAQRHGLLLIEDAAHAIESRYHGRKVGALGDIACFSFYVTKNMTSVEGGMLCTDDGDLAQKARICALHGMSADAWDRYGDAGFKHYEVIYTGHKFNMTDLQAAIALPQLRKLEGWLPRRQEIWRAYDEAFADLPCETPAPEEPGTVHARHLYTVLVDEANAPVTRDELLSELHRRGVGAGVHYRALHTHAYYRERFGFRPEDFPHAYDIGERTVSLPLSPDLTDDQVLNIQQAVRASLAPDGRT